MPISILLGKSDHPWQCFKAVIHYSQTLPYIISLVSVNVERFKIPKLNCTDVLKTYLKYCW